MNGALPPGAHPLGAQQVAVDFIEVLPIVSVDILEGGILPGPFTHNLRIVVPSQRKAYLVPVDATFLRSLGRQCQRAGGITLPADEG